MRFMKWVQQRHLPLVQHCRRTFPWSQTPFQISPFPLLRAQAPSLFPAPWSWGAGLSKNPSRWAEFSVWCQSGFCQWRHCIRRLMQRLRCWRLLCLEHSDTSRALVHCACPGRPTLARVPRDWCLLAPLLPSWELKLMMLYREKKKEFSQIITIPTKLNLFRQTDLQSIYQPYNCFFTII